MKAAGAQVSSYYVRVWNGVARVLFEPRSPTVTPKPHLFVSRSARSAARPYTTSCASRLPRPYHFRAGISIFSSRCGAISGHSVLSSKSSCAATPATERLGSKIDDQTSAGTNVEQLRSFGKRFVERLGNDPVIRPRHRSPSQPARRCGNIASACGPKRCGLSQIWAPEARAPSFRSEAHRRKRLVRRPRQGRRRWRLSPA